MGFSTWGNRSFARILWMLSGKNDGTETPGNPDGSDGKGKAGKAKTIELTMKTATFLALAAEVISIW